MPRVDSLTGLRWWAAFAVFAHHMGAFAPIPLPGLAYGTYGVTFFFVLSGFVLTWSATAVRPQTFWWRRFARIYPSHAVALLLAIPVFYSFSPAIDEWWVKPFDMSILLLSVFLLQGWSRDPAILFSGNPAAWTLTCEAFFYALHPALNRGLVRVRVKGALIVALSAFGVALAFRIASIAAPDSWLNTGMPYPVARLTEFVIGMSLAWAIRSGWRPRTAPVATYILAAAALAFFIIGPDFGVWGVAAFTNEIIIAICAMTILAVALRDLRGGFSLLRSRVLVRLGEWSYAFYLVHATMIYAARDVFGSRELSWWNLVWYAVILAASLAVSAVLHYGVERYFERRLRRWWNRREVHRSTTSRTATTLPAPAP